MIANVKKKAGLPNSGFLPMIREEIGMGSESI